MKKLSGFLLGIGLVFALTGCHAPAQKPVPVNHVNVQTTPTASPTESLPPEERSLPIHTISLPGHTEIVTDEQGVELLHYSYPQPRLFMENETVAANILADLQARTDTVTTLAKDLEALARDSRTEEEPWAGYFVELVYTPTRLDSAVLSLFGNQSAYSGGPHPSMMTSSVTYDLQTGAVLSLDQLLTPECTPEKLYQKITQVLAEQAENLYYDYAEVLQERFTGELHSLRDWYFSKSGLCFHFAPYDIAPYSSGTIVAELPYEALSGILEEKFFPEQISTANGSMYAEPYPDEDAQRFTSIVPVELPQGDTRVLLYSDAPVADVRIETGFQYPDSQQYIPGSVIFTADVLDIGHAIRLTADLSNPEQLYRLVYHAQGQEFSAFITYDEIGNSILLTNG